MHEGLLAYFKQVGPLLRVLKLLKLRKQFKQFLLTSEFKSSMIRELYNSSARHLDPCSDGVDGWRYYFCVGYKNS